jgi:hypothetical protein
MPKEESTACKYCNYCKHVGTANSNGNNRCREPRKSYYCENPIAYELPRSSFGNKSQRFIAFGTSEWGSPVNIKTSPKWCPFRQTN